MIYTSWRVLQIKFNNAIELLGAIPLSVLRPLRKLFLPLINKDKCPRPTCQWHKHTIECGASASSPFQADGQGGATPVTSVLSPRRRQPCRPGWWWWQWLHAGSAQWPATRRGLVEWNLPHHRPPTSYVYNRLFFSCSFLCLVILLQSYQFSPLSLLLI